MVEALAGAGDVPREVDGVLCVLVGELAALGDAHVAVLARGLEVGVDLGLGDTLLLHVRDGSLVKRHKLGRLDPVGLERVNLGACRALGLHGLDGLGQGLELRVSDSEDELVVADVDGAADELAALRVCPGEDEVLAPHDVPLEARRVEAVDVLAGRHEDLTGEMAAFLAAVQLVLEVYRGSAVLREELGELENGGETSVPGVTVGDDGPQVVCVGCAGALLRCELPSGIPLLTVVHRLSLGEALDLVRYGVVWVVAEVGGHLVGGCEEGRAGPAGDVEDLLVRRLLGHLDGIDSTHYLAESVIRNDITPGSGRFLLV